MIDVEFFDAVLTTTAEVAAALLFILPIIGLILEEREEKRKP
jgi:hypothetical protein